MSSLTLWYVPLPFLAFGWAYALVFFYRLRHDLSALWQVMRLTAVSMATPAALWGGLAGLTGVQPWRGTAPEIAMRLSLMGWGLVLLPLYLWLAPL